MAAQFRRWHPRTSSVTMSHRRRGVPVSSVRTVSFLWRPVLGARDIGWGDAGLAAALSVYAILLVGNVVTTVPHGGAVAAVAVLAMTAPVAWERRAPVAAAAGVVIGAGANELLIGKMVRCGPALPAVFVIAFFAGTRLTGRRLGIAAACCLAAVSIQALCDPRLGAGFMVGGLPIVAGGGGGGRPARALAQPRSGCLA